ncbi:conjugal transfer protein TraT [Desulfovibrio sp. PG-178-WT-4]|uniref:Conjugal transfer protein TraT n=2 Tax=Desulfovibrio porci TaxID=2605782 RepID=A0A6L5XPX4_9BACT|nr:conjugal transfer protein TraT [Desulfovibrio porci]
MPIMRLFLLLLLGLSLIPLNACVRQRDGDASEVEVLRSGALNRAGDEDIPNVVYVNVRDMTNRVFHLRSQTEAWLGRKGFTVTDNPSQAGYIVQITVLAAGQAAPESLRGVVDAGYDAPSVLSGTGGTALLADVLLVQRRVPSSRRPSRTNLKNISNRNAVASSQMRLGLLVRHDIRLKSELPAYFADVLARELSTDISAADSDTATATAAPQPTPAR